MRASFVFALAIATLVPAGARAAESGWTVSAGWGVAQHHDVVGLPSGREMFVAFERATPSWLHWGGEVSHVSFAGGSAAGFTRAAFTLRAQPPAEAGVQPFVVASAGLGAMDWGSFLTGTSTTVVAPASVRDDGEGAGEHEGEGGEGPGAVAPAASLGLGVRALLPGAWPDLEFSLHAGAWGTSPGQSFLEPRIGVSFR